KIMEVSGCSARLRRSSTSPSEGDSSPPMMRISVVLPQPEGPTMQMNSPSRTSKSQRSSATTLCAPAVKVLRRPRTAILTPGAAAPSGAVETRAAASCTAVGAPTSARLAELLDRMLGVGGVNHAIRIHHFLHPAVGRPPVDVVAHAFDVQLAVRMQAGELHLVVERAVLHRGVLGEDVDELLARRLAGERFVVEPDALQVGDHEAV